MINPYVAPVDQEFASKNVGYLHLGGYWTVFFVDVATFTCVSTVRQNVNIE